MLESVKPGDKLWVSSSNGGGGVAVVKRITPKGFVVAAYGKAEVTFRQDGNERTSDTWLWRMARPITDEDVAEMRLEALRRKVQVSVNSTADTLTSEQCQAILRIIKDGE